MDYADFAPPNKVTNFDKLKELASKKSKASWQEKVGLASRLDWSDIESIVWKSPEEIEKALSEKEPLAMPRFPSLPKVYFDRDPSGKVHESRFQPMYAFNVSKPNEYPQHVAEGRKSLVASGSKSSKICRPSVDLKNVKTVDGSAEKKVH